MSIAHEQMTRDLQKQLRSLEEQVLCLERAMELLAQKSQVTKSLTTRAKEAASALGL